MYSIGTSERARKVAIKRWAAQVHAAQAVQGQGPTRTRPRPTQPRPAQAKPSVRDPKAIPLDQLTKEEKKKQWKRVVKAAKRSLVDEYHYRLGAHYKDDYEIKKCFGLHGGNEERLWISEKSSGGSKLTPTTTQTSATAESKTSFKHTLKKARRSFKDEGHFLWHGTNREDFDMLRRRLGYYGGDEERLWNPIFGRF